MRMKIENSPEEKTPQHLQILDLNFETESVDDPLAPSRWDDTPTNKRQSKFVHENEQMFLPEIRCRSNLDVSLPDWTE